MKRNGIKEQLHEEAETEVEKQEQIREERAVQKAERNYKKTKNNSKTY